MRGAVALVMLTVMLGGIAHAVAAPVNVVLVSVDTLNRSAVPPYAPDAETASRAPSLARFAGDAAWFTRAYSTASWTLPAHASMLTGLYPDRHGANHSTRRLAEGVPTLAELLRAGGFETTAFTGAGYVSRWFGLGRGFDLYDGYAVSGGHFRPRGLPRQGAENRHPLGDHFDRAIAFVRQHRATDPPFFLFLHTFAVHDYFKPHESVAAPDACAAEDTAAGTQECLRCGEQDWALLRAQYRAAVDGVDRDIGAFFAALDEAGLRDSTLVVLTADHGEGFDPVRQRIRHGGRLHADLIRIPLLVRGPNVRPGRRDDPISLVDLLPTILGYLDLPIPPEIDGQRVWLDGAAQPATAARRAMEHAFYWTKGGERLRTATPQLLGAAFIAGDRWYLSGPGGEQLYDMASDPDQEHNLAPSDPALATLRALAERRAPNRVAGAPIALDDAQRERLRALGYE